MKKIYAISSIILAFLLNIGNANALTGLYVGASGGMNAINYKISSGNLEAEKSKAGNQYELYAGFSKSVIPLPITFLADIKVFSEVYFSKVGTDVKYNQNGVVGKLDVNDSRGARLGVSVNVLGIEPFAYAGYGRITMKNRIDTPSSAVIDNNAFGALYGLGLKLPIVPSILSLRTEYSVHNAKTDTGVTPKQKIDIQTGKIGLELKF